MRRRSARKLAYVRSPRVIVRARWATLKTRVVPIATSSLLNVTGYLITDYRFTPDGRCPRCSKPQTINLRLHHNPALSQNRLIGIDKRSLEIGE